MEYGDKFNELVRGDGMYRRNDLYSLVNEIYNKYYHLSDAAKDVF